MTIYLGKNCSFGFLCVSCVGVFQLVNVLFSLMDLRVGCGIRLYKFLIIVLFYFVASSNVSFD